MTTLMPSSQHRRLLLGALLMLLPMSLHAQDLATLSAEAMLAGPGRTITKARTHHVVVDAPPPLGGANEAINPIELLLSALATCGVLVCEKAAQEQAIPLTAATASVQGRLDPRGVRGADVDPRLQGFDLTITLTGPTQAQAEGLVEAFKQRCPVYTTLIRAAPIRITTTVSSP